MSQTINGAGFRRLILNAAAAIELNKQALNELNVFPVPDGDTGTNMSMTINAAAADLRKLEDPSLEKAAGAAASAMLRGASPQALQRDLLMDLQELSGTNALDHILVSPCPDKFGTVSLPDFQNIILRDPDLRLCAECFVASFVAGTQTDDTIFHIIRPFLKSKFTLSHHTASSLLFFLDASRYIAHFITMTG